MMAQPISVKKCFAHKAHNRNSSCYYFSLLQFTAMLFIVSHSPPSLSSPTSSFFSPTQPVEAGSHPPGLRGRSHPVKMISSPMMPSAALCGECWGSLNNVRSSPCFTTVGPDLMHIMISGCTNTTELHWTKIPEVQSEKH